ncbi:hypothetical protein V491_07808 [Pseudogymnoascus sp. VKM F-3775]|nr:hypothetical protein V491_07808 [Pseudogymnoascus sp. VKM F-3775]
MSPRIWDPYSVLNIIDRNSNSATCVGKTRFDKRCRWDISDANIREIRAILNERERKSPKFTKKYLRTLAQLSLCEGYHQGQASEVIGAWEDSIDDAEANVATDSQIIADLKLKLQKRESKIAQQSKELGLADENEDALRNEVEQQRSQIAGQRRDLDQAMKELKESLVRTEMVEAQRLTAYNEFNKLRHDLIQAVEKEALLSQEVKTLRRQHAKEVGNSTLLRGECDYLKAELSNAQNLVLGARLDLENSHNATDAQRAELDTLRVTLKATKAELSDSHLATERQTAKLHDTQNITRQVQLDLQTLREANVELEANFTAAQSTLKQTQLESENNRQTAEKQQSELANVQKTLDQTVVELVNSRKSNEERDGELSVVKKLLQQTELDLEKSRKSNGERDGELSIVKELLQQTELDLETSRKRNEEQDGEFAIVKKLLQQIELDLETSRKVDKSQKADLERNLKAYEEQKAKLDSTQALLKTSQVELESSHKTALGQKETADALVTRMRAQIVELEEQLSRGFIDRVVLRFKKWFATVMRGMKRRVRGQREQEEERSHMMV